MSFYDLHLHSDFSDGDVAPTDLVEVAKSRGLAGLALTDHNGVGGLAEAEKKSQELGLKFVGGIEVSARYGAVDVHMLGYSESFNERILNLGLEKTCEGYRQRVSEMVSLCKKAGFNKVSMNDIEDRRLKMPGSTFISFDVAYELMKKHKLGVVEAHRMTVKGGLCYVPYGNWAMSPGEAVELIHKASGLAVLAHPGIIEREVEDDVMEVILKSAAASGLDGLEVYHPFHSLQTIDRLMSVALENDLVVTGGSDWHGMSRFPDSIAQFGKIGVEELGWKALHERLKKRHTANNDG